MTASQWVQKRQRLVEDFVQGRTLLPALLSNKNLCQDTLLAMRDTVKDLRVENAKLEELLNPTVKEEDDGVSG